MTFELKRLYTIPDRVMITAHRGFSGLYPENTLDAFMAAVDLGADILEFDVRGTKDGVPIILHDATFERTANRPGAPGDYTLSEVKEFEASYWHGCHDDGVKLSEPALPGARIPTFEELLSSVGDAVGLNIQVYDISPPILAEVCRLYREFDLYSRGYLTMPTLDDAELVREIDADIEICVTDRQGQMDIQALERQKAFGCSYVQPLRRDVTREFCMAAREMGLHANMFYANTDEDNRTYIHLGVQGILTDRPDVLIATLQAMGRR